MERQTKKNKSAITCNLCCLVLSDPLPCHCVVCGHHIMQKDEITCAKCKIEFPVPAEGFKANEFVPIILENELHLTDEEKNVKR